MNEPDFEFLRTFLKAKSGLALPPEKRYLIESRLAPVCRSFDIASLADLVRHLRGNRNPTLESAVVDAMTTNETFFFRDKGPFDLFRDVLLPRYLAARSSVRHLRIWCAAASTGQEPYSLAMLLEEASPRLAGWKVDILATDISTEVLAKARAGLYNQFEVQRGLPIQLLLKYFTQVGDQWQISSKIRGKVEFRPLNLIKEFGHIGPFDIIYCRNVLIYFDSSTKSNVLSRIANVMAADGSLILGAAETVLGLTDALLPDSEHRGLYGKSSARMEQRSAAPLFAASR
ncbi:CheR family methyltransferase [Microvirga thermotolerans]|uniref:protein-glutamate O-methyltransferase n=1 Tax=Microvirga thermotolerans TaxID=2651334 RepID=A0A5P9K185_9HYPH|nr:protein-glutamate O-methyltransferase CheR [Microvirga thermotolerans]QFU17686.1 chemotaxis protein CheR [Microvirga thermotolerans]